MALFDLSQVVRDLSDEMALAVTRPAASTYTAGRLDTPSTTAFTIGASVQPTSGRDLKKFPEGTRISETRIVFTPTELMPRDLVVIDGEAFEVQGAEDWGSVGSYWKAFVRKTGH